MRGGGRERERERKKTESERERETGANKLEYNIIVSPFRKAGKSPRPVAR